MNTKIQLRSEKLTLNKVTLRNLTPRVRSGVRTGGPPPKRVICINSWVNQATSNPCDPC